MEDIPTLGNTYPVLDSDEIQTLLAYIANIAITDLIKILYEGRCFD